MKRRALLTAGAVVVVAACSGGDQGSGSAAPDGGGTSSSSSGSSSGGSTSSSGGTVPRPLSPECAAYADGFCTYLATCAPAELRKIAADVASCTSRVASKCALDEARPGAVPRSPSCSAALKAAACTGPFLAPDPSCDHRGLLADGASCYDGAQCQSGYCPGSLGDSICGACAPRTAENGACRNDDSCEFGSTCHDRVCRPFAKLGEACDFGGCVMPLNCVAGRCREPLPEGAECLLDECDIRQGLKCADTPGANTCQKIVFGPAGTSCGETLIDRCDGHSICPIGPLPKKCETIANENENCRDLPGICVYGTECSGGLCRMPPADHCR